MLSLMKENQNNQIEQFSFVCLPLKYGEAVCGLTNENGKFTLIWLDEI